MEAEIRWPTARRLYCTVTSILVTFSDIPFRGDQPRPLIPVMPTLIPVAVVFDDDGGDDVVWGMVTYSRRLMHCSDRFILTDGGWRLACHSGRLTGGDIRYHAWRYSRPVLQYSTTSDRWSDVVSSDACSIDLTDTGREVTTVRDASISVDNRLMSRRDGGKWRSHSFGDSTLRPAFGIWWYSCWWWRNWLFGDGLNVLQDI